MGEKVYTVNDLYSAVTAMTGPPNRWTIGGQVGSVLVCYFETPPPPEVQTSVIVRWPESSFKEERGQVVLTVPVAFRVHVNER